MEEQTNNIVEKKTNGFAIAGLVCSILLGGILGLILSIIGIINSKKCNSGKGMSIAGLIISVLKILLVVGLFFVGLYAIKNTDEGKEYFCESMSTQKESCTLKKDGTYDCIFATCDFDNVKESKEDEEEQEPKGEEKEDSKSEEEKENAKDTIEENITISYDNKGTPSKKIEYVNNVKKDNTDFYNLTDKFIFADYDQIYFPGEKEYKNYKILNDGTLSTGLEKETENKYYPGLKNIKFVSIVPYNVSDIGFWEAIALSTSGDLYEIKIVTEEDIKKYTEGQDSYIPVPLYEKRNYNRQGNNGKITEIGYISYVCDTMLFTHEILTINGKKYYADPSTSDNKLVELTGERELYSVIGIDGETFYSMKHLYNGDILLDDKLLKDKTTNENIKLKYAIDDIRTGKDIVYIVDKENKIYYVGKNKETTIDYFGYVNKIVVNEESLIISLTNGETISIK